MLSKKEKDLSLLAGSLVLDFDRYTINETKLYTIKEMMKNK